MTGRLDGKKIAILLADGFEQVELTQPRAALAQEGAQTVLISPQSGKVKAWNITNWGELFEVDVPLDQTTADEYDAPDLPGGVMNPDQLRTNAKAVHFTARFSKRGNPQRQFVTRTGRRSTQMCLKVARSLLGPRCKWIFTTQAATGQIKRLCATTIWLRVECLRISQNSIHKRSICLQLGIFKRDCKTILRVIPMATVREETYQLDNNQPTAIEVLIDPKVPALLS